MSETGYLIIAALLVLLVISIVALARDKNIRQHVSLPWMKWKIETSTDESKNEAKDPLVSSNGDLATTGQTQTEVDFGTNNEIGGKIGDIAARDIIHSGTARVRSTSEQPASLNFGKDNKFTGTIGDIAGRDIHKADNDTIPHE